jgi:hypothetical protein
MEPPFGHYRWHIIPVHEGSAWYGQNGWPIAFSKAVDIFLHLLCVFCYRLPPVHLGRCFSAYVKAEAIPDYASFGMFPGARAELGEGRLRRLCHPEDSGQREELPKPVIPRIKPFGYADASGDPVAWVRPRARALLRPAMSTLSFYSARDAVRG